MKLFLICDESEEDKKRNQLLVKAAKNNKIELIKVGLDNYQSLVLSKEDALYRTAKGPTAEIIQKILIAKFRPKTFYISNYLISRDTVSNNIVHKYNNVPIVKTEFVVSQDKEAINETVNQLGGWPIVFKEEGKRKGLGVHKVNDCDELIKLISSNEKYLLREFIESPGLSYRAIVLGEKVIFAYMNKSVNSKDFRSNIDQEKRERKIIELSKEEEKVLVKATRLTNVEFGAVDFAYDKKDNNKLKIFEVNSPFNFGPAEEISKKSIAEQMILYLMKK